MRLITRMWIGFIKMCSWGGGKKTEEKGWIHIGEMSDNACQSHHAAVQITCNVCDESHSDQTRAGPIFLGSTAESGRMGVHTNAIQLLSELTVSTAKCKTIWGCHYLCTDTPSGPHKTVGFAGFTHRTNVNRCFVPTPKSLPDM